MLNKWNTWVYTDEFWILAAHSSKLLSDAYANVMITLSRETTPTYILVALSRFLEHSVTSIALQSNVIFMSKMRHNSPAYAYMMATPVI